MKKNKKEEKKTNIWKEILSYVLIILVVILIRSFIVTPARVSGPSMEPTLIDKDYLFVLRFTKIDRNDIIVFKYDKKDLVKRVIGIPGDTLTCSEGDIYLNGKLFNDKYTVENNYCFDPITLGKDEYFVLGDNRKVSKDSRMIGKVNKKDIIGTTNFRLFPLKKIGKFNK